MTDAKPKKEKAPKKEDKAAKKGGQSQFEDEKDADFVNTTPFGQMKDMTTPMAEKYNPKAVEASWDGWWHEQGFFRADNKSEKEKFVIVIPPPNVTGTLHIGHALTDAIQDAVVRWERMRGKEALWVPGFDHAGIATQIVVERKLMKEQGKTRHDLGREAFLKEIWDWVENNSNTIKSQTRQMGCSVDWSRSVFTMDGPRSEAVKEAFIRMYEKGLIFRADRLVGWSCTLKTAISSIEIDHVELEGREMRKVPGYDKPVEFGVLHSFAYKFKDSNDQIIVSTTRIETMLGDVAVAVHSQDPRYIKFHGKELVHPFIPERKLVLICDDILVDPKFGTGAVKITPGHDPNDFECGQRHKLPQINIFDDAGIINANGGPYKGLPRFVVREKIIEDMKKLGIYHGSTENKMSLGICSRSGDVIEPVIRPQWWVNTESMCKASIEAVKTGKLQILPEFHKETWYNFLEENRDWCISRQLWWGHRIPAYYVQFEDSKGKSESIDRWVVARSQEEAEQLAKKKFPNEKNLSVHQDEDVLDTWFSSGLFPFSVFGWPNNTDDMKAFYPTTLLETGSDILFFWVARMVMMGLTLTGELPFKTVFLHGIVRDKDGNKMSKSKGNVIDPLDIIHGASLESLLEKLRAGNLDPREVKKNEVEKAKAFPDGIATCGADALRFGLLSYTKNPRGINLDPLVVVSYRQFCNKLWNATRFALLNFDQGFVPPTAKEMLVPDGGSTYFGDRWILSRLHVLTETVDKAMREYEFADATQALYSFWLKELCSVYLELLKPIMRAGDEPQAVAIRRKAQAVLWTCFDYGLRLLHPFMPFVTEELYHRLPGPIQTVADKGKGVGRPVSISLAPFPQPKDTAVWTNNDINEAMELAQEISAKSRSLRSSLNLTKERVPMYVHCSTKRALDITRKYADDIRTLSVATQVTAISEEKEVPPGSISTVVNAECTLHIPLKGLVDVTGEVLKLDKKLAEKRAAVASIKTKTSGANYAAAPEKVKKEFQEKLDANNIEISKLVVSIDQFLDMMSAQQIATVRNSRLGMIHSSLKEARSSLAKLEEKAQAAPANDKGKGKAETQMAELRDSIKGWETDLAVEHERFNKLITAKGGQAFADSSVPEDAVADAKDGKDKGADKGKDKGAKADKADKGKDKAAKADDKGKDKGADKAADGKGKKDKKDSSEEKAKEKPKQEKAAKQAAPTDDEKAAPAPAASNVLAVQLTPEGLQKLDAYLASRSYLFGYSPSQADVELLTALGPAPSSALVHLTRWYLHISAFTPAQRQRFAKATGTLQIGANAGPASPAKPAAAAAAAAKPAKQEEDDLFSLDDDGGEDVAAALKAKKDKLEKEKAEKEKAAKEKAKAQPVGRSSVVLDVSPAEEDTDLSALEKKIRAIQKQGLNWGACQVVPLVYTIKKLRIMCTVVDEEVSVDDLTEEIEAMEECQSATIFAFNKI